ncbi:MAG: CrcB family protein [Oceanicaulis sp.]|nr:CrcB family protein [Oceanicaulis sp.]
MLELGLIALGGALGAAARLWAAGAVQRLSGSVFPFGTLAVNVSGAALLGALAGMGGALDNPAWAFFAIGVLGSYTTVSSFTLETLDLARTRRTGLAALNIAGSFALTLLAAAAGYVLVIVS